MEITKAFKQTKSYVIPHEIIPKGISDEALGIWFRVYTGIDTSVNEESNGFKELQSLDIIQGSELTLEQVKKQSKPITDKEREHQKKYGVKQARAIKECAKEISELNTAQKEILSMWLSYRKRRGPQYTTIKKLVEDIKNRNLIDITAAMNHAIKVGSQGYFFNRSSEQKASERLQIGV